MSNNSGSNCFTEKEVLHDALEAQKHVTGMFNSYSNECANPEVRKIMLDILNDEHSIQFDVFNDMQKRGFYPVTPAQQDKVNQIKSTYAQQASSSSSGGSGGMSGMGKSWSGGLDTTPLYTPGGGMDKKSGS